MATSPLLRPARAAAPALIPTQFESLGAGCLNAVIVIWTRVGGA